MAIKGMVGAVYESETAPISENIACYSTGPLKSNSGKNSPMVHNFT